MEFIGQYENRHIPPNWRTIREILMYNDPRVELTSEGKQVASMGDLNIDLCEANDPQSEPDIRALQDHYLQVLYQSQMCQVNFKPTRHRIKCRS